MPGETDTGLEAQLNKVKEAYVKSDDYHSLRNKYTVESAQYLLQLVGVLAKDNVVVQHGEGPVTIVELGAGTGLLTEAMMAALKGTSNIRYIATDPTESMQRTFKKNFPDVEFMACTAENIPMPASSVQAILAGASYHWFATQEAYQEIHRVLQPGGMTGYITNLPSETQGPEWAREINTFLWECYRQSGVPWERDMTWKEALLESGLFTNYKEDNSHSYFQEISMENCVECFASYAGVRTAEARYQEEFRTNMRNLLDEHFTKKDVQFTGVPYITEITTAQTTKVDN